MSGENSGYWPRLWRALLGHAAEAPTPTTSPTPVAVPETETESAARAAGLALELQERDRQVAELRAEYERLQAEGERRQAEAEDRALEGLFRRLATPLAQFAQLAALQRQGRRLEMDDLAQIVADLERACARAGLERIGGEREEAPFDPLLHERLSGGAPGAQERVLLQAPGYRYKGRVLAKAVVAPTPHSER